MTFEEENTGLFYTNAVLHFPEYFDDKNLAGINQVLEKWDCLKVEYTSIEDAFSCRMFSDQEAEEYALWRTAIYYGENFGNRSVLCSKIFNAILAKFTGYYLALANGA